MLEMMQALHQPGLSLWCVLSIYIFSDLVDVPGSMGKIQDMHCLWAVKVRKVQLPIRSIHHGSHGFGIFYPPPLYFHQRQALKLLGVHFSRKITQIARMNLPFALFLFA